MGGTWNGNVVGYGSGGHWYVQIYVWDNGSNASPTTGLHITYRIVIENSMSDDMNSFSGSDPLGAWAGENLRAYSAGSYDVLQRDYECGILYGGSTATISMTATGFAGTGPSSVSIGYPMPGRAAGQPSAPYGYYARNITQTTAYTGGVSVDDAAGGTLNAIKARYSMDPGYGSYGEVITGSWTDAYMTGCTPGGYHYFKLAVGNGYLWSNFGASATFTTLANIPSQPAAPTISAITSTTATASMVLPNNGGAAINSTVWRVYNSAGTPVIDYYAPTAITSYGLTGLSRASNYTIGVFAHNATGYSAESPRTSFTTAATVPDQMAAPTITNITTTTATAVYVAPNNGGSAITSYGVERATNAAFTTGSVITSNGSLTGLTPSTPYWVRVRAGNAIGAGAWSAGTAFTSGATIPSTPAAPTVSLVTDNSAKFTWVAPANNGSAILNYVLQLSTNSGFTALVWEGNTGNVLTFTTADMDRYLNPKVQYWVRVAAQNSVGGSQWSASATFTTLSGLFLNVGGTNKACDLYLKDAGTYKLCELWENVAGVWKKIA